MTTDQMRAEFEAAYSPRNRGADRREQVFKRDDHGDYLLNSTQRHWWTWQRAWQASRATPIPTGSEAAALKDAQRYRWLRDKASGGDWEHIGHSTPETTDAAVDEAMRDFEPNGEAGAGRDKP